MMLFKTPRVLVTNSYQLAKKFADNTTKDIKDVNITDEDKAQCLLDATSSDDKVPNSYYIFESLEYSLGYGGNGGENNFKIILTLNDYYSIIEESLMSGLLDWDLLVRSANSITERYSQDPNKEEIQKQLTSGERPTFTSTTQVPSPQGANVNSSDVVIEQTIQNAIIGRTYYFIFINELGEYLDPIVSQFHAVTANQSSKLIGPYGGLKQVKLEFICVGHPNLISNLASVANYSPAMLEYSPFRNISSQRYEIKSTIDFNELLATPVKIDIVIKDLIKKIFQSITGKEVLLVLPDFSKLFLEYKQKNKNSVVNRSFRTPIGNSDNIKVWLDSADLQQIKYFFNKLGFDCIVPANMAIFDAFQKLSAADKEELESLTTTIDAMIAEATSSQNLQALVSNLVSTFSREKKISIGSYEIQLLDSEIMNLNDFAESVVGLTGNRRDADIFRNLNPNNRFFNTANTILNRNPAKNRQFFLEQLTRFLDALLAFRLLRKGDMLEAFKEKYPASAAKTNNLAPQLDYTAAFKQSIYGSFIFVISSKSQQTINAPKINNQINFYEFANDFSNNLQMLTDFPYKISFTEENNFWRLNYALPSLFSYEATKKNPVKAINTTRTGEPVVVIFESFMYDNYFLPITGIPRSSPKIGTLYTYPISDVDLKSNYHIDSDYFKQLKIYKKNCKNKFLYRSVNIPFVRYPLSLDALYMRTPVGNVPSDGQTTKRFCLTVDKSYETLKIFKSGNLLTNFDENSVNSLTFFHYDPNIKVFNQLDDVVSYNLKADSLNSTNPIIGTVQKIQSTIYDDKLLDIRIGRYETLFKGKKYEDVKKQILAYIKSPEDLARYKKELSDNLKDPNRGSLETRLKDLLPASQQVDSTNFTAEQRSEYLKILEEQQDDFASRVVNQVVIDSFTDFHRYAKKKDGGVLKVMETFISDSVLQKTSLYKMIYEKIYQIEIETHPYYQINDISHLNSPVVLLIRKNRTSMQPLISAFRNGDTLTDSQRRLADEIINEPKTGRDYSLFSGIYKIISFKHTLTKSEFKSNFILRKNLSMGSEL